MKHDYGYYQRKKIERWKREKKRDMLILDIFLGSMFKFWIACGILGLGGQSMHWTTDLLVYAVENKKQNINVELSIEKVSNLKDIGKRL